MRTLRSVPPWLEISAKEIVLFELWGKRIRFSYICAGVTLVDSSRLQVGSGITQLSLFKP